MREQVGKEYSLSAICQAYDKSRQAYYKKCQRLQGRAVQEDHLVDEVRKIRS